MLEFLQGKDAPKWWIHSPFLVIFLRKPCFWGMGFSMFFFDSLCFKVKLPVVFQILIIPPSFGWCLHLPNNDTINLEEEFHAAKNVRNLLGKKVLMEVDGYFGNFPFHFPRFWQIPFHYIAELQEPYNTPLEHRARPKQLPQQLLKESLDSLWGWG